jgi:hypothetical protein
VPRQNFPVIDRCRPACPFAEPIYGATLTILTEFADKGRYNHLDTLGSSTVTSEDAGLEWDNTVLPLSGDASAAGRYPFSMPLGALVRVHPGE